MARVMEEEEHGFSHLMQRVQNGIVFYMALGQGQAIFISKKAFKKSLLPASMPVPAQKKLDGNSKIRCKGDAG